VVRYVRDRVDAWRTGSGQSQLYVLTVLLSGVAVSFGVSVWDYRLMPLTAYFVWLLLGMLTLRFLPLVVLALSATTAALVAVVVDVEPMSLARVVALLAMVLSVLLVLFVSSRQRSGLPSTLSEAMLSDLRDRLQSQSALPELPGEWLAGSAMIASQGVGYAGDFLVADLSADGRRLEMVLVDVCGKGVAAGSQALHFAGALGGLLGAMEQPALFHAANAFLLRQHADESFSTAVHLRVDLETGRYAVTSAGHPPALRWDAVVGEWVLDNARGMALGIMPDPDLDSSEGVLQQGEALLFYTDGVVESRSDDLDVGIAWLRATAREAIGRGYPGAARRIVHQVERGDDDRAVLILSRGRHPVGLRPGGRDLEDLHDHGPGSAVV
jgi:hypothetical protein